MDNNIGVGVSHEPLGGGKVSQVHLMAAWGKDVVLSRGGVLKYVLPNHAATAGKKNTFFFQLIRLLLESLCDHAA